MRRSIAQVTLVVRDYDEAIEFFTQCLGFELIEDTFIHDQNKRWVVVAPVQNSGAQLLLAKATTSEQQTAIGQQTGGRVAFFLHTDDFARDFERLKQHGVPIVRVPEVHPYGTVAVFQDLCGNLWDLIQPAEES